MGLPTTTPGATGGLVVDWARKADRGPFASLAVLDRLFYDSLDPFTSLAAAAAVTERTELATMVAIGPLRATAVLAHQAATVHDLAGGRFTLGLGVGARRDDYLAAGVDHRGRGERLSEQLAHLRVTDYPGRLLVGGSSGPAFARMARYADGYAHGGGPPRAFASAAARAAAAWEDLGRPARPLLWGQAYFTLTDPDRGAAYLRDYYAFTGPFAETVAAANLTNPRAIKDLIRGYAAEGCDMLVLLPTVSNIAEVDLLAEVLP